MCGWVGGWVGGGVVGGGGGGGMGEGDLRLPRLPSPVMCKSHEL